MITHTVEQNAATLRPEANHLLIAIDCSGSMSGELPMICGHLKDSLPKLVRPGDRVSLIWFSGRGECGRLVNAELISGLGSLAELNASIDRWLAPVGLTGFQAPAELLLQTVRDCRSRADWQGSQSVQFLSDGHDNQSSRQEILRVCTELGHVVDHAVVVEYGHYADRRLLSDMAAALGGTLTFAQDFQGYHPELDAFVARAPGLPRRTVALGTALPEGATALAVEDGEILQFTPDPSGEIRVPGDVQSLAVIAPGMTAERQRPEQLSGQDGALVYAAISVAAARMDGELTEALLQASGDARLLASYRTVLGKQRFADFAEEAKLAAFDPRLRLQDGQDFSVDLNADTLSVLEVMDVLSSDPVVRLMLSDPAFSYSRIGPARVRADGATTAEQTRLQVLSAQIASGATDPATLLNLQEQLQDIQSRVQAAPKFRADDTDGLPIDGLVWNREQPNLSVRTHRSGHVTFEQVPGTLTLPDRVPSGQIRTYAVVRDGLVNVGTLPVRMGRSSHLRLTERGLDLPEWNPESTYLLPLSTLPVISRAAAGRASLQELTEASARMISLQGSVKVYNELQRRNYPPLTSQGLSERYGEDEAAFLRAMGLTDHGFNPASNEVRTGDVRPVMEFRVAIKGLSSLPKVSDIEEKLVSGKTLTPVMTLLVPALKANDAFLRSPEYQAAGDDQAQADAYRAWLQEQVSEGSQAMQALEFKIASSKFALIVGQRWFTDSTGPADATRTVSVQPGLLRGESGTPAISTTASAELKEKELQI